MKNLRLIIFLLLQVCSSKLLLAQVDAHFSQYYANPLWLNPALTGVINGNARLTAQYKNQWASINNAYQTGGLTGDFRADDHIGLGINVLDQSAGSNSYNYFTGYGSFSYGFAISNDGNHRISFGLQAGIVNRTFNMNNLQFGNQFNGVGYDPSLNNFETFTNTVTTVFDSNAGVFYYDGTPDKSANVFGGVSVGHLNRPKDPFSNALDARIPLRYTFHGGVRIKAGYSLDLTPNFLYVQQQKASIKAAGLYSEFKIDNDKGLILGALYRVNDAAVANVGFRVNSLIIGTSYDFNTSSLNQATGGRGGLELSVSYVFLKHLSLPEPICPRL
ncbi:PorP/SprF family type IX secretion system membrane protein [Mucilaginibacter ginkgonis]|uniref:PorP/SprF family type IX secretion system membrane protein n=1 Tax=Mucilaginibacter ginkgonis TaxID=2682091 RepID=A0A6I4HYA4_9SPHI|nr:PorP/SprF family type IX secretion system membrane protein [Mucilaginibacter ginkgonis]QQL50414.1 PorP/SprF family type IX secretion system membrane protein [Mucilaginibacter ginkgonis]